MGKVKRLDVQFSSTSGAFNAGNSVTGNVILELNEASNVKNIKIKFVGEARVTFSTTKPKKTYNDNEKYFEQIDVLYGSESGSVEKPLDAGLHTFPFVFAAPNHLPSSFEHKNGYIRYWCKVTVSRTWTLTSDTCKKPFTIVSIVDLNLTPDAFTPGYAHSHKQFSLQDRLLCCVRGGLTARLRVSRKAYVPGEKILINAEISNHSSLRVKRVETYLQQNMIFKGKGGSSFIKGTTKIGLITQGAINRGNTQVWHDEPMSLTALPPSGLGKCKLITVDYLLNLVVHVDTADAITLTIPIILGTVPLRPVVPPRPPPPNFSRQPSAPPLEEPGPSAPPPSYEECVFMESGNVMSNEETADCAGPTTYKPLYPTYAALKAI